MHKNVKQDYDSFIITCRGAPLPRIISLQQWQARKSREYPTNKVLCGYDKLLIQEHCPQNFSLECCFGHWEIRKLLPNVAPINSIYMYNVQNKRFKTQGEIVAPSLTQGGSPPLS